MTLTPIFISAGLIFFLRIIDVSMAIVRILMVMRGLKALAWLFGFVQALVFVIAIRQVMADLGNWVNMLAYAAGFATGTVAGIWLEERIAVGYGHMRVISSRFGAALAESLRQAGYAVTEVPGRGKDGAVDVLILSVPRRRLNKVTALVEEIDPHAFVTVENVRPLYRGFFKAKPG